MSVRSLHLAAAVALVGLALLLAVWGLVRARRMGRVSHDATVIGRGDAWWRQLLALSQTLVVATGVLGLLLLGDGDRPEDPLHGRVYGPFMVVALLAAWGFRTDDERWNTRVFAVTMLFVAALGVRAITTGYG